jgi:hypothetical protein
MLSLSERFDEIDGQVDKAMAAVENDTGASPVLYAVVEEFRRKSLKALDALKDADKLAIIEHVIEVEQAADSAKYAAEADNGLSQKARKAILDAHMSICILKSLLSRYVE